MSDLSQRKHRLHGLRKGQHALGPDDAAPGRARAASRSAGVALVLIGTISYALGADWNPVDALYFSVATLTATSVSDPDLVLEDGWMKLFTVFYQLIGIGILVEVLRRFGLAFVAVQAADKAAKRSA